MRTCDIAILGMGLMGSAAFKALQARGADVIGFDPLGPGADRGSSHGSCRIFRRFNFESRAYTALSDQAFAGWRALERESGEAILRPCPILEAGPRGSEVVRNSAAAAREAGRPGQMLSGAAVNARFPAFELPDNWEAVLHEDGGILLAAAAMRALRADAGARIVAEAALLRPAPDGLHLISASGEVVAQQVIVAAGPWLADVLPVVAPLLKVTRQMVGWFGPARPETVAYGSDPAMFPIFLIDGPDGFIYGFPDFEGRGVKAARHDHGPPVSPEAWGPPPTYAELAPVSATLDRFIPGAAGPITGRDVCLYTNTVAADLRPDAGEEFILDRLPQDPRIIVASACSGHGAKFAPAIGDILAALALDAQAQADPAFRLDRFSAFAEAAPTRR